MEEKNFSEKKIENSNNDEKIVLEKKTKVVFDYDQLDYVRFELKFMDGFNFGLGLIISLVLVNLIILIIILLLNLIGFSFFDLFFNL